ncbi:Clp protease N-terminal domain-containing protein [Solwaraspora sp. WMMA2101]|uniref:Clp protease N-terminal domain-containing protein n=1 Tax=Solwaraspora sp. WMMA2101 TaxID=3404124 RepID=UPI003B93D130
MPKINVYLPDDLADAVRDTGIPVSAVCQQALEQAVRRVTAVRAIPLAELDAEQLAARLPHLTGRLRDVLLRARDQARAGGAAEVGTGHLLAALLDEGDNLGVRVLRTLDVSPAALAARSTTDSAPGDAAATLDATGAPTRWSVTGAGALELAVTEATALGHNYVGCEHLLLGLVAEPDGAAGRVLRESGADLRATRRAVAAALVGYAHLRAQTAGASPASGGAGAGAAPVGAEAVAALVRRELAPVLARLERLEQRAGASTE